MLDKSDEILHLKGKEWQPLNPNEQEKWIERAFKYWRKRGFPYYKLSNFEIKREYINVAQTDSTKMILGDEIQMSMTGIRLANYYHPQMWEVQVSNCRSSIKCFNNDDALKGCIRKALTIWPNRYSVNESCMRRILKTYQRTASVSNFRPTVAKAIYQTYSSDGDIILDFSAGYGGRLLGCFPLKRNYIGIDPCKQQVIGLKSMIKKLDQLSLGRTKANIYLACAEEFMKDIQSESIDLVFSSPPYFDKERYCEESTQSYVRYPYYHQWLSHFLEKIIYRSYLILKPNKYFIINVADINNISLSEDTFKICQRYFKHIKTMRMRLGLVPYKRKNVNQAYKFEPIYIFQKPKMA